MSDMLPESPLSSLSSSDEADDHISTPNRSARPSIDTDTAGPPSKKRRTGGGPAHIGTPHGGTIMATGGDAMEESEADISCDSEGSAPGSPSADEFAMRADQVTTCAWEGCSVGDLANSDELIAHVQNDHIAPKRARYTCEWGDCARKGTNHPSGYALKAHMRSHTKEKPFFCHLPGMLPCTLLLEEPVQLTSARMRPLLYSLRCPRQTHAYRPRARATTRCHHKRQPH